jgi:hypothetical protein
MDSPLLIEDALRHGTDDVAENTGQIIENLNRHFISLSFQPIDFVLIKPFEWNHIQEKPKVISFYFMNSFFIESSLIFLCY